jgi:hypothetical protein
MTSEPMTTDERHDATIACVFRTIGMKDAADIVRELAGPDRYVPSDVPDAIQFIAKLLDKYADNGFRDRMKELSSDSDEGEVSDV